MPSVVDAGSVSHPEQQATWQPVLEVMAASIAAVELALAGGADRIELVDNVLEGGTTPSAATISQSVRAAHDFGVPVMVMIRPRGGGFVYDRRERAVMAADLSTALELGAAGVVFGALDPAGGVDAALTAQLLALAVGAAVTFHRAVDVAADLDQAVTTAFDLGVHRVLTSGGAPTATSGASRIARLVAGAPPGRQVIAAAGIRSGNLAALLAATGVREVHASARHLRTTGQQDSASRAPTAGVDGAPVPGWPAGGWPAPDPAEVRALARILHPGQPVGSPGCSPD